LIVKLDERHRLLPKKTVVESVPKVHTNQTTAPRLASIASPVNTKTNPEKINALIVQQALFQKTFVPTHATCPEKDLSQVLQKQGKWPSLWVGVPIVPGQALPKDAAALRYVPLEHLKPIEPALIVLPGIIPPVAPPVAKNATKGNLHRSMPLQVAKYVTRRWGLWRKQKEALLATVARLEEFPRVKLVWLHPSMTIYPHYKIFVLWLVPTTKRILIIPLPTSNGTLTLPQTNHLRLPLCWWNGPTI
jgi:hypothetical protein